jgi:hypothetical protein
VFVLSALISFRETQNVQTDNIKDSKNSGTAKPICKLATNVIMGRPRIVNKAAIPKTRLTFPI